MFLRLAALTAIALMIALMPLASAAQNYNQALEDLNEINRIQPLQNPEYLRGSKVLGNRILDRKNKVVGEVKDVLINGNGSVNAIGTEFSRLRLGSMVYISQKDLNVRPVTNGYALGFDDDQIESLYPELLANMETASGDDSDMFSIRKIQGAPVKAKDGRNLGVVEQVLFSSNGMRAEALYVTMKQGTMRGKQIAVPFRSAEFVPGSRVGIEVSNDVADAMTKIVKN